MVRFGSTVLSTAVVVSSVLTGRPVQAQDAFASVQCGADISKVLIGKVEPGGRVVLTESRHRDIGLAFEGSVTVSDRLRFSGWTM